jgi:hypothetical protein
MKASEEVDLLRARHAAALDGCCLVAVADTAELGHAEDIPQYLQPLGGMH